MLSRMYVVLRLIPLLLLHVFVSACSTASVDPPASTTNPPIYPGATRVQVQNVQGIKFQPAKLISFEVDAEIEQIQAFYKDKLSQDHWRLFEQQSPDQLDFYWVDDCPNYGLTLVTVSSGDGMTAVSLKLQADQCY